MHLHPQFWFSGLVLLACAACAPVGKNDKPAGGKRPAVTASKEISVANKIDTQPETDGLKGRLKAVLDHIEGRELLTTHAFWTVIHGILGNGMHARLHDPITGRDYNAIDYICQGGRLNGLKFTVTGSGVDVQILRLYGQGHQDQFIGEMAQCGIPLDKEFLVEGKKHPFKEFLDEAKAHSRITEDQELSWTLVALSQYYGTDFSWTNRHGEKIRFEDAVRYELNQPIETKAACGGTHRLFGLTWAYYTHLKNGGKTTGVWKDVAATIKKFQGRAHEFQNADGTFSTEYFHKSANSREVDKRIGCTGHIVEWLSLSLPDEELKKPWMKEAIHALIRLILDNESRMLDAGSVYHAAHGLHLYYNRIYAAPQPGSHGALVPLPPR